MGAGTLRGTEQSSTGNRVALGNPCHTADNGFVLAKYLVLYIKRINHKKSNVHNCFQTSKCFMLSRKLIPHIHYISGLAVQRSGNTGNGAAVPDKGYSPEVHRSESGAKRKDISC